MHRLSEKDLKRTTEHKNWKIHYPEVMFGSKKEVLVGKTLQEVVNHVMIGSEGRTDIGEKKLFKIRNEYHYEVTMLWRTDDGVPFDFTLVFIFKPIITTNSNNN